MLALPSSLSRVDWCRLRATEGCADLMTRLNLRARLAKRLLGVDRALGSAAETVWKALRMIAAMY